MAEQQPNDDEEDVWDLVYGTSSTKTTKPQPIIHSILVKCNDASLKRRFAFEDQHPTNNAVWGRVRSFFEMYGTILDLITDDGTIPVRTIPQNNERCDHAELYVIIELTIRSRKVFATVDLPPANNNMHNIRMNQDSTQAGDNCDATLDTSWLDGIIEKLNSLYNRLDIGIVNVITLDEIVAILTFVTKIINQEGSLVEVEVPIKVIGDIHGQYQDMHKLFDLIGRVPDQKMMFLGDYVDRGPQSLETIVLLLALKLRHREKIYLLRGNHETPAVNRIYGFYDECCRKYGVGLWWEFQTVFNRLPMAGLISKKILCMHGGLSPELTHLDQIRQIVRPCEPQDRGMLIDLLWSDPTNKGDGWFYSPRGISYAFGKGVMSAACKILGIDMVIRAHQVVQDGYELMVGRQLITIFSAPNYCGQFNNAAAVVCIDADMQVSFQQLRTQSPPNCNRPAPPCAADLSQKPTTTPPTFKIIPAAEMEAAAAAGAGNEPNNNEKKDDSKKDGQ